MRPVGRDRKKGTGPNDAEQWPARAGRDSDRAVARVAAEQAARCGGGGTEPFTGDPRGPAAGRGLRAGGGDGAVRVGRALLPDHPDEICGVIAEEAVAELLRLDPSARVAIEVCWRPPYLFVTGALAWQGPGDAKTLCSRVARCCLLRARRCAGAGSRGSDPNVLILLEEERGEPRGIASPACAWSYGLAVGTAEHRFLPLEQDAALRVASQLARSGEEAVLRCQGEVLVSRDPDGRLRIVLAGRGLEGRARDRAWTALLQAVEGALGCGSRLRIEMRERDPGGRSAAVVWTGCSNRSTLALPYGPLLPPTFPSWIGRDPNSVERAGVTLARREAVGLVRRTGADRAEVLLEWGCGPRPRRARAFLDGREACTEIVDLDRFDRGGGFASAAQWPG